MLIFCIHSKIATLKKHFKRTNKQIKKLCHPIGQAM